MDDIIAARAMDVFSKYSILHQVKSKNPQEAWDVFCAGWLGTFGPPKSIQMDAGGERKNEVRTDYCSERRIELFSRAKEHIPGYWNDGMVLREASTIDLLQTIGSPAERSLARCNGALTPCSPPVDSLLIRWSLDPTQPIYLDGVIARKTYYLRKIPRWPDSL